MISAPLQFQFPPLDQTLPVLLSVSAARARLPGHDEDDIASLVDLGYLLAFDISLLGAPLSARELRILPQSVEAYARAGSKTKPGAFLPTWPQLILARDAKPFISSTRIAKLLNCSASHVINLVDAGLLKQIPGTQYGVGPTGAAVITRDSFLAFLKSRLEGA